MCEKAFTNGWLADDETRQKIRREMESMILDPKSGGRDKIAACKAILAAERIHLGEREVLLKEKLVDGGGDGDSIISLIGKILEHKNDGE